MCYGIRYSIPKKLLLIVALLLCDWLRSIENEPTGTVRTKNEQKVLDLVKELLTDADISVGDGERLSAATLNVWAGTFDDVWVWGRTLSSSPSLSNNSHPFIGQSLAEIRGGNPGNCSSWSW